MPADGYKRPESVLVLVYTRDARVLLLRRADPPDYWQSVTGSLLQDERPDAAARRELLEETGIRADERLVDCRRSNRFTIAPEWQHLYAPNVHENVEHIFHLALDAPRDVHLNPDEHVESVWLSAPEALRRATSTTNQEAIRRLLARL